MSQSQAQTAPQQPRINLTDWARQNVAGNYQDAAQAARLLQEASNRGCRVIGGTSVMPIPLGKELCVTVVPIEETSLFPMNSHAKAYAKTTQGARDKALRDLKDPDREEQPRWGIGKAIINTLATAAGVEWLKITRLDDGSVSHYCVMQVWGRYPQADGTYRPITDVADMDYREGSAQLNGKTEQQKAQLRATLQRKAITGAMLRALRTAFGIDHGINDDQIDRPFIFSRVIFTGRTDDPAIRAVFAQAIAQQFLVSTGALYVQAGNAPMLGGAPVAPQLTAGFPSLGGDEDEEPASGEHPKGVAPAPLPPEPPKPPLRPGDPNKVYMPGKDQVVVAKALDKDLTYWEKRTRQEYNEGIKPEFAERTTIRLLTIRAEMRRRNLAVEPHEELDALDPKASAARQNGERAPQREPEPARQGGSDRAPARQQQRPPSDRGARTAPRHGEQDGGPWEGDDRGDDPEDDGRVPPDREPPLAG